MTRVLVVDDSRGIRLAIKGILKSLGIEVEEAGDGQEALAAIEANGLPDAILLDWNMPNMTGLEFLQAARAKAEWSRCPIIMVTTNNQFEHINTAIAAGANEYVMKPFDKELILGKLESVGVTVEAS